MSTGYRELLDAFGTAWERGDVEAITSLFTPEAVFLETPFGERSVGIAAIRDYWKDVPTNQAEVSFRSGEIYVAGPWFATEFRCTYRRRRTGEPVDARGAIFCETKDGKISRTADVLAQKSLALVPPHVGERPLEQLCMPGPHPHRGLHGAFFIELPIEHQVGNQRSPHAVT